MPVHINYIECVATSVQQFPKPKYSACSYTNYCWRKQQAFIYSFTTFSFPIRSSRLRILLGLLITANTTNTKKAVREALLW